MKWRRVQISSAFSSASTFARARLAADLSQRDLAKLAGVNPNTVRLAEHGWERPRFSTADKLANALGLTVADLWPTLERAVKKGRLLDTVIPIEQAAPTLKRPTNLRLVHDAELDAMRVQHKHRPPICCGSHWCRCVELEDPETYPVFGDPRLIEFAGGVNG